MRNWRFIVRMRAVSLWMAIMPNALARRYGLAPKKPPPKGRQVNSSPQGTASDGSR